MAPGPTFKHTQLDRDGEVKATVCEHSSALNKEEVLVSAGMALQGSLRERISFAHIYEDLL